MDTEAHRHWLALVLVGLLVSMPYGGVLSPARDLDESAPVEAEHASPKAQTTWSGTVTVTTSYTIAVFDELVVSACTQIELGAGARIYIEGRLTVEGTRSCHRESIFVNRSHKIPPLTAPISAPRVPTMPSVKPASVNVNP